MSAPFAPRRRSIGHAFLNLPTGTKMLAIISLALVPLGLIALLASLQANRTADQQRRADLRVAVSEGTRKLGIELGSDLSALSRAADTIETDDQVEAACTRLAMVLRGRPALPIAFALFAPDGRLACASRAYRPAPQSRSFADPRPTVIFSESAIDVQVFGRNGAGVAMARYPSSTIAELVRPIGLSVPYSLTLLDDLHELPVAARTTRYLASNETFVAPIGQLGLSLRMSVERAPINGLELLITFLPLVMWASAAAVAFLVLDRLLIGPLAQLRAAVAGLKPGERFVVPVIRTPALEIRELGETFGRVGEMLIAHEQRLATALEDQVKLTREVHHRVKNNLQVIASLISLHARGARGDVADAYASIQRRVDALAIVHRNHYAELEANAGISVKALLGELAANLRAGAAATGISPAIATHSPALKVSQDVAVPIAFLVTELTELSMAIDRSAALTIAMTPLADPARATLSIESRALQSSEQLNALLGARYGRIVDGLARQLRVPMMFDGTAGRYAVEVSIRDEKKI